MYDEIIMMDGIKIMGDMETITIEDIMIIEIIEGMIETQEMKIEEDTKDTIDLIKRMKDHKEDYGYEDRNNEERYNQGKLDMKTIEKKEIIEITITFEETTEKEDEKKTRT
ncbi:hypothetical protein FQR65_LT06895 [Abscondita terminalis]|nr:hypothetical protein FQR65_LT06895 [Abscondita terminalis]